MLTIKAGAEIVATAADAWTAELVVKVKEPLASEYGYLRDDLLLFTYLHMAAASELAEAMLAAKTTGIAYETVLDNQGQLPLLVPMSEVAGRMMSNRAHFLLSKLVALNCYTWWCARCSKRKSNHHRWWCRLVHMLLIASSWSWYKWTILDISAKRLSVLEEVFGNQIQTLMSNSFNISKCEMLMW